MKKLKGYILTVGAVRRACATRVTFTYVREGESIALVWLNIAAEGEMDAYYTDFTVLCYAPIFEDEWDQLNGEF